LDRHDWGQKPKPALLQSLRLGEWLEVRIRRRNADHVWRFGFDIRAVSFGDHRSPWSAIRLTFSFGPWSAAVYPIYWWTRRRPVERIITLQEKLAATHGTVRRDLDDDEED
jgi:hypothetical protein